MSSQKVKDWRIRTKARIVEAMGGKCNICGYNRCEKALELHHINPKEKEFSLASIRGNPKSWDKIVVELKKCVLLCANCHREVEAKLVTLPETITSFDENYINYKPLPTVYKVVCSHCGNTFNAKETDRKFCSPSCVNLFNRKVDRPSREELKILIETTSWVNLGKQFGVSDNTVRKWARRYNLI
jgi:protein-arginine kinase activator protein McsA